MFYWRNNAFKSLTEAASYASAFSAWDEYAQFCSLLSKGLRKDALKHIRVFVPQAVNCNGLRLWICFASSTTRMTTYLCSLATHRLLLASRARGRRRQRGAKCAASAELSRRAAGPRAHRLTHILCLTAR
jgi:hypothetical protein